MAYGDGTVHQLPDGRWRGTFDAGLNEHGKRRRPAVFGRTEAEARRKLRDKKVAYAKTQGNATAGDAGRKTVAAWAKTWLENRVTEVRPKTFGNDKGEVNKYIVPTIGRRRLVDLGVKDVRSVNNAVRAAGCDEPTVLRVQRVLIKMLRDALEEGYAVPDPVFNIKVRKAQRGRQKPKREALELPQAIAVLAHAAELEHGCRWLTGFYEGMRQGEVLGLTWDAVDFETGFISLEWQLQALPYNVARDRSSGFRVPHGYEARHLVERFHLVRPKTDTGWRVIPMVDTVRDALAVWHGTQPANPHGLVWTRADGRPIPKEDDAEEFRQLQRAAGVKHPSGRLYVGHEIRNTTATLLAEAGVEPTIIQAILGHSSYAISQGYIAARRGPMMAAMREVEAAFTTKALPAPQAS
jgi:integrase